jgi:hypothetical protein
VRILTLVLIFLAALSSWSAAATKHPPEPRPACALPKGWRVVAKDRRAVVIVQQSTFDSAYGPGYTWQYCARRVGSFYPLIRTEGQHCADPHGPPSGVYRLTLSGGYIAYDAQWACYIGPATVSQIRIFNVARRETVTSAEPGRPPSTADVQNASVPTLLLSPGGTAVWLWTSYQYPNPSMSPGTDLVQALVAPTRDRLTLDTANKGGLANLRLYRCVGGCAPTATVSAWTHDGSRRYASVD